MPTWIWKLRKNELTGRPYVTSLTDRERREVCAIVEQQIIKPYLATAVPR